jgi:SAM-dependent methyltransferase
VGDPKLTLARSFGRAANDYELGRPLWPDEVADVAELDAGATVLDLAAGTGKLTRVLVRHFAHVIAVEPDDGMRALIPPGADVRTGSAEALPLEDASLDGAFVAEAFHWFDYDRAVAELARVLKPGAPLVLVWNLPTDEDGGWEPDFPQEADDALTRRFRASVGQPGASIVKSGVWRKPFAAAPFAPLVEHSFPFVHVTDRDGVIAYWLSVSSIAALPEEERDELARELHALVPATEYRLHGRAHVELTHRL